MNLCCCFSNELTFNMLTSIVTSVIAFIITTFCTCLYKKYLNKKMFHKLDGNYLGFSYINNKEWELNDKPQSKATIRYIKKNILEIVLSDLQENSNYIWIGKIIMNTDDTGKLTWWYNKYNGIITNSKNHKFGIKRIVVKEIDSTLYLYLVEENLVSEEEFKKEILIKSNSTAHNTACSSHSFDI